MNPTPSQKKNTRAAKQTVLLVGEGYTETAFLKHLKKLYVIRQSGVSVKVSHGEGGDPKSIMERARRLLKNRAYDRCLILMDTDLPWPDELPSKFRTTQIEYVASEPCIEGFLLRILGRPVPKTTNDCKKRFHKNVIPEEKKTDPSSYTDAFPKKVIEASRKSVPALNQILDCFDLKQLSPLPAPQESISRQDAKTPRKQCGS